MTRKLLLLALLSCAAPSALQAQERAAASPPAASAQPQQDAVQTADELVVTGSRPRGSAIGDIKPEETFSPADVQSFGVSSVSDLLDELTPQTTSVRGGAPVVLLNGRRISNLAEIRDIPTEAIRRVEILPEEVALKYGYPAEQKVVNIVLRDRFRARTGEASGSGATEGGQNTEQLEAGSLRLNREGRFNVAARYSHSDALLESERGLSGAAADALPYGLTGNVVSTTSGAEIDPGLSLLAGSPVTVAGTPARALTGAASLADFAATANQTDSGDVSNFRSLLPQTDDASLNVVYSRSLPHDISATANVRGTYTQSTALLGLAQTQLVIPTGDAFSPFSQDVALLRYRGDLGALEQTSQNVGLHAGATLDGTVRSWGWSVTGNYDLGIADTSTDRGVDVSALQTRLDALDATFNPFGALPYAAFQVDTARSVSNSGDLQAVVNGAVAHLPAGDIAVSVKLGGAAAALDSRSVRSAVEAENSLSRLSGTGQVNLDVPIAKRSAGVLPILGDLSANLNLAVNALSDFGALTTLGYGVNWSPITPVRLAVSMTDQKGAPTMEQLGGPLVYTPGARTYDFVTGQTVDVTRLGGGNPDLKAEDRRFLKLDVSIKPPMVSGLSLVATYLRTRTDNPIASFPAATAQIEDAFPDRFTRDADGQLTQIDARPVNFARQESDQIRWGLNFSRQIGKTPPRPAFDGPWRGEGRNGEGRRWQGRSGDGDNQGRRDGAQAAHPPAGSADQAAASGDPAADANAPRDPPPDGDGPPPPEASGERSGGGDHRSGWGGPGGGGPGGGGPGGGPGGPGGFGGPPGGGAARLQLAIYHTVHLREQVLVREGLTPLNLLNGDVLNSTGGQPRHEVEAQLGFTRKGLGARLSANWQSATRVNGNVATGASDLRFSGLTTVNLRLFDNLGGQRSLVEAHPLLRGVRVSVSVNNLLDSRIAVRDATGAAPVVYQSDYLDALGRSVRFSVRKIFF